MDFSVAEGVGTLRLDNPPVNALDLAFMQEIGDAFAEAEKSDARAVILTGTGAVFSAGADLFSVLEGGRDFVESAYEPASAAFENVFRFPKPLVAAINGHALAGGCVLACAADVRIAADGDLRIGLPELRVGVTFPSWALETVRLALPNHRLQELIYGGRAFGPADAQRQGFVDRVVPAAELMDRALETAGRLARIPAETFRLTKEQIRRPYAQRARTDGPGDDRRSADIWASDEAAESIRAFLRKTLGTDVRPGAR